MNVTIEIDEGSGFCFGVTTAIRKAEEELAHGGCLYCLGDIVHNGSECERLRALGLATIDHEAFGRLHDSKVLLRAHGEPPETYATAHENRINIIDATCPVVLQLQRRIKHVADSEPDAQLVIYGKPGHAEVIGLVGQTAGRAIVIERPEDVERLDLRRDIRLFSQTTQPLEGFRRIPIFAETFAFFIVIHIYAVAFPRIVAFNPEMVVALRGKPRLSGTALKQPLREGYARRNAIFLLLAHGGFPIHLYICKIIRRQRLRRQNCRKQNHQQAKACFF